ncbi:hypothetical protein N9K49_02100 [Flavobacteriaceae bacterium]|nr:hypothetical protein [Flavobacteriaceae bacterium]
MRLNLTLLVFFCSLYGFAQLYVQKGTTLSLESPQTILSSQEIRNQIDAPIVGQGTLYLNRASKQQLSSTQTVLELPTLHVQNADVLQIETALNIHNQFVILHGLLSLSHDVVLTDPTALVLAVDAHIHTTTNGQLIYTTQFEQSQPMAVMFSVNFLKYTDSKPFQMGLQTAFISTPTPNFGSIVHNGYKVYFKHSTPPPKAV